MTDLGLYNYIKNALAQGKSKEAIYASLNHPNSGWKQGDIDTAFADVQNNNRPILDTSTVLKSIHTTHGTAIITTLAVIFFIGLGIGIYVSFFKREMTEAEFKKLCVNSQATTILDGLGNQIAPGGYATDQKLEEYAHKNGYSSYKSLQQDCLPGWKKYGNKP